VHGGVGTRQTLRHMRERSCSSAIEVVTTSPSKKVQRNSVNSWKGRTLLLVVNTVALSLVDTGLPSNSDQRHVGPGPSTSAAKAMGRLSSVTILVTHCNHVRLVCSV
jgi:hypothetical protein